MALNVSEPVRVFEAIAGRTFAFLVTEFGMGSEKQRLGASWIGLRFRSPRVILQFALESNRYLLGELIPLDDGQEPRGFDADLREHRTTFDLNEMLRLLDPSWSQPASEVSDVETLSAALGAYAAAVRTHARNLLLPDASLLRRLRAIAQRRSALQLLPPWSDFVSEVRGGYRGELSPYVRSIATRAVLEDTVDWNDPFLVDVRQQLLRIDDLFDQATVPLTWGPGALLPSPRAARWWRRPRDMPPKLGEEFRRTERDSCNEPT